MADLTIKERVASVEAHQEEIRDNILEMKTNHLPHIEQKIDAARRESTLAIGSLRTWIMGALLAGFLSLVGVVINLLVQLLA